MVERLTPTNRQAQPPPSLEQRVVNALDEVNANNIGSDTLSSLIADVEIFVAHCDEVIASEVASAENITATPSADAAQQAILRAEAARINKNRLDKVLPELRDKYAISLSVERKAKWAGFFQIVEKEREPLARELGDFLNRVEAEQQDLRSRIREWNNDAAKINAMGRSIDEYRSLEALELPNLVQTVRSEVQGHDWRAANSFAASFAQSMMPRYDPARWSDEDVRAQQRADAEKQQRELAAYHEREAMQQEERLNREERERFMQQRKQG